MPSFHDKWSQTPHPTISERINDTFKPQSPLKPKIQMGIKRLRTQITKLDAMLNKLKERDNKLFKRIVETTQNHDVTTSRVLSKELAEVRNVTRVLSNARMALEKIELRLTTYHDLGDTVVTIMPTLGLMKSLKTSLAKFMPGADQEIHNMAEMLGGFMTDSFSGDGAFGLDDSTSAESEQILQEASAVAATSTGERFPTTPANVMVSNNAKSF